MTDARFNIPAVKTARPLRATGIHTHTYIHTLPRTFQHIVGMNPLPSIRVNRDKADVPPAVHTAKTVFWVMMKTETNQNRNDFKSKVTFSHSHKCDYTVSFLIHAQW